MVFPAAIYGWVAASIIGVISVGVWYVKDAQVEVINAKLDKASEDIATRDRVIGELQRAQRSLIDSVAKQNTSIEAMALTWKENLRNSDALLERVKAGNVATTQAIASLAARMAAPGATAMTCREALQELRSELMK